MGHELMIPRFAITLTGDLSPSRCREVGRLRRVQASDDGRFVAVMSELEPLSWRARTLAFGQELGHRISIYTADLTTRIAVFDNARYPINAVAFSPEVGWVAIGTGAYDDYSFDGELLLWNWETGETRSLLGELREVVDCRFVRHDRLAALLRPRNEDDVGDPDHDDAFETYLGLELGDLRDAAAIGLNGLDDPRLDGLRPVDPSALGFDPPVPPADHAAAARRILGAAGIEERHHVWDACWLDDHRIATVHARCLVEIWDRGGDRVLDHRGPGHGIQLLRSPRALLVNVLHRGNVFEGEPETCALLHVRGREVTPGAQFDRPYALSIDAYGRLLARDVEDDARARLDLLLDADGQTRLAFEGGAYDRDAHHLRLDGGPALVYLARRPAHMFAFGATGDAHDVGAWDRPEAGGRAIDACAVWWPDGTIVRAYRIDAGPGAPARVLIERTSLSGELRWCVPVDTAVTALAPVPDAGCIVFALTSGVLGAIDAATGELLHAERLCPDHVATVVTSLDARDHALVAGTLDGRVLQFQIAARPAGSTR